MLFFRSSREFYIYTSSANVYKRSVRLALLCLFSIDLKRKLLLCDRAASMCCDYEKKKKSECGGREQKRSAGKEEWEERVDIKEFSPREYNGPPAPRCWASIFARVRERVSATCAWLLSSLADFVLIWENTEIRPWILPFEAFRCVLKSAQIDIL